MFLFSQLTYSHANAASLISRHGNIQINFCVFLHSAMHIVTIILCLHSTAKFGS